MAVTVTVDDVIERIPALDGQDDQIELILPEALRCVGEDWDEDDAKLAVIYMTAHLLQAEEGASDGTGQAISSESFGPMSVSYATPSEQTSDYKSSEWGRRYLRLLRRNVAGVVVARGGC